MEITKVKNNNNLTLINMSDIESKEVKWLWYPYIPFGKLTIVQGDPGEGKTTFILNLSSLLSRGMKLPYDSTQREPIKIIYQTAEDGLSDTIKPRLEAANADCNNILVIDETESPLSMSDIRLEEAIKATDAKLIILDPIQAYLGSEVDMHRANEIRPILKKLGNIAEKYECAIVLIGHMNKANGIKSTYRGLGSIDFQATARSVLVVGRIKYEPNVRVIAHDKSSLAPEGKSIAFELNQNTGFQWIGQYDITVDELLSGDNFETKTRKAEQFLEQLLQNGKVLQTEIMKKTSEMHLSTKTVRNAKSNLNIISKKIRNQWYWLYEETE